MARISLSLLRGICQTPAYVAMETGLFRDAGIEVDTDIAATAWLIPHQFRRNQCDFAIMPWTRVACGASDGEPMIVIAGSGVEEAALVVRRDLEPDAVRSVSVPREGGIKDLTAMALIEDMGWSDVEILRQPSGDGAIIALFGRGADAASMVEPYATLMAELGVGRVIRRTGDIWKGAPGCSLTTTRAMIGEQPGLVQAVVDIHRRAVALVREDPEAAAAAAEPYIGVHRKFILQALSVNRPDADAVRHGDAMGRILDLMRRLGYIGRIPEHFLDLRFLDGCRHRPAGSAP